jgi:O-antigen ligase
MQYLKAHGPNAFAEEFLGRKRVYATFITPNIFASYIIIMSFVGIGQAVSGDLKKRIIHWLVISLMLIALMLTKSLGGILTFVTTAIVLILFLWFSSGIKGLISKRISFVVVFALSIFLLICGLFIKDRLAQFFSVNNPNNSFSQRFYYWKASLSMFKHFPITGIGWRKFGALYIFYKPFPANISNYSHNVFLQIMTETGLVGFLVFLGIIVGFFRRGINILKSDNQDRLFKIGLFCAGISFLIHNLVDLSFYFGQVALFWWIILGLFINFSNENLNATI